MKKKPTLTGGPGGVSSSTWVQMLRTFRRWENSCSTIATNARSDKAAQGSSTLCVPPLLFVLLLLLSSSPAQGFRRHLGATAAIVKARAYQLQFTVRSHECMNRHFKNVLTTHQQADCHKAKVRPGVQRDPMETRQRRVKRAPY